MNFAKLLLSLLVVTVPLFSQTNLSGSIGGMTLEKGGNPFIVSENITIPAGKSVTILDSCVFLFKPFTGIIVEGSLEVKGTSENPVVFTSINNSAYNPNASQQPDPFDWNGIVIDTKAHRVHLSNFTMSYSVYGIKSSRDDIVISKGLFFNNGQFHFTIHDEIKAVTDSLPFNYQPESDTIAAAVPKTVVHPWKRPTAAIFSLGGLGGLGAMGYCIYRQFYYHKKYLAPDLDSATLDHYYNKQVEMRTYEIISGIAGGVLLCSGITLFSFDLHDRKRAAVALYPSTTMYGLLFDMEY